ncbi:sodium:proton antiporter [Candidatus Marinamargulisbacteria bacterium SCGC AG-333-B06]|nr:sodium:proton antiporter [Candidatus Marinamargulisbacteria bacterium SCGC AG-333-B06]
MIILSIIFILLGLFFFLGTTIGMLRLPDFYSRAHAAGKADTLSTILIVLGCALFYLHQSHFDLSSINVSFKLFVIILFVFIGSPTATHAIMDAGFETGVDHWSKKKDKS